MNMRISLKETELGLRNSTVRIPFRYGRACLIRCPQAVLRVKIEAAGHTFNGYSGDCLPPSWFDKSIEKSYRQQIDDMLAVIGLAEKSFTTEFAVPTDFFPAWAAAYETVHRQAAAWSLPPLLVSFGTSMLERALIDAAARAANLSFADAVRQNIYQIQPGEVHPELEGLQPADWLPAKPADSIFVRHTVGLSDPLTEAEIRPEERLDDGLPHALEQYIQRNGVRYFKLKVSNDLQTDIERLATIADLAGRHLGDQYFVTLDGNEQYASADQFDVLIDAIRSHSDLEVLWRNTIAIEQPLARGVALDPAHTAGIRRLGEQKPVIIDESDGTLEAYREAIQLGYRGTSSKNCKGPIKSLLNAGLTWLNNERGARQDYVMTGEDLCTVGIVAVQADLCLVASLGLSHIERNGHHFLPGLTYLPAASQQAVLAAHPDLYRQLAGQVAPHVEGGRFQIGSLQCAGFGFAVEPDMHDYVAAADWEFASLGLED